MDWNGTPDFAQHRLTVSVWHDIVQENSSKASSQLPTNDDGAKPGDVVVVWQNYQHISAKPEIATFTQQNLVSAISALITTLPLRQRLSPSDLVLPASSFNVPYVLCQTLAALYQHSSLAITSVAEPGVDLALTTRGIAPTVIIASAETMAKLHKQEISGMTSSIQRFGKFTQSQTMEAGRMPTDGWLFQLFLSPARSSSSDKPGTLRLILIPERLGGGSPPLTSTMLSDLRIFTRARICYALTTSTVCGAVAQSNVFDYRREDGGGYAGFGVPLSSVEVKLKVSKEEGDEKVASATPEGEIVVSGPAVAGAAAVDLGVRGRFREDGTLAVLG